MSPEVVAFINELTSLLTGLGVLVAALVSVVKPLRTWLISKLSSKTEIREATAALKDLAKKFDVECEKQELIKNATLSLTRNSLTRIYYKAIERGGISAYDRENFLKMYDSYSALGGNSYVHEIYEQVLKMPSLAYATAKKTARKTTRKTTASKKK